MILPLHLRPKILLRFLTFSTSSRKWISASPSKSRPPQSPSLLNLSTFFNSGNTHMHSAEHELTLLSALKSCASNMAVSQGRQIHCLVLKSGLSSNTFINNSILNMYAKCGLIGDAESIFTSCWDLDTVSCNIMVSAYVKSWRLEDARRLFDVMPSKGCVSYTTMIMGFAQNDRWAEAVEIFRDMRNAGVAPNEVSLASVISSCAHLGGIWDCKMLHALSIKLQLEGQVLISTNLLHMYCVCSSLGEARSLFDEMQEKNIVSWNVMLNGYSKAGLVELARDLFERIPEKDVVSWGTMIDGYVQVECLSEALMLFCEMLGNGAAANDVMVVDLISACGRSTAVNEGLQLHGAAVKRGFDCYDFVQATIIHFYAACGMIHLARLQFEVGVKDHIASRNALIAGFVRNGMIEQARDLFNEMSKKDIFSWSTMISGYAQSEQPNIALELFRDMIASRVQPNQITMVSVCSAIASLGRLNEAKWAHKYVRRSCMVLNDNLSAAIIDMYAKCGSINTALQVFYQVRDRSLTISPWNAIICGLAMHGHANLSLETYLDLQRYPIKPNSITFIGVLSACCHAGFVDLGKKYFKSMKSVYNIEPEIKHYGCMVDLLGRAGKLEDAEEIAMTMPVKADVVIWGTLLAACRTHGNVDIGERAANSLAMLEPTHGGGKVLMSNIYADAGRWDDVFLVRKEMQSVRVERSPGFSAL